MINSDYFYKIQKKNNNQPSKNLGPFLKASFGLSHNMNLFGGSNEKKSLFISKNRKKILSTY